MLNESQPEYLSVVIELPADRSAANAIRKTFASGAEFMTGKVVGFYGGPALMMSQFDAELAGLDPEKAGLVPPEDY